MATKKPVSPAVPPVASVAPAEAPAAAQKPLVAAVNAAVVSLLEEAAEAGRVLTSKAREAAEVAAEESPELTPLARYEAIVERYAPHLGAKSVRDVFTAALAVRINDKPCRMAVTSKSENAKGQISLKAPEALPPVADKGEILPEGKMVVELTPEDAAAKLPDDTLKIAAKQARADMGAAPRSGGRPAAVKPAEKRASYWEETVAVLKDASLRKQLFGMLDAAGYIVSRKTGAAAPKAD